MLWAFFPGIFFWMRKISISFMEVCWLHGSLVEAILNLKGLNYSLLPKCIGLKSTFLQMRCPSKLLPSMTSNMRDHVHVAPHHKHAVSAIHFQLKLWNTHLERALTGLDCSDVSLIILHPSTAIYIIWVGLSWSMLACMVDMRRKILLFCVTSMLWPDLLLESWI